MLIAACCSYLRALMLSEPLTFGTPYEKDKPITQLEGLNGDTLHSLLPIPKAAEVVEMIQSLTSLDLSGECTKVVAAVW